MFTLLYNNGQFNRPESLPPFLQSNVGKNPLVQIDCITPYRGTEMEMAKDVCDYLSQIDPQIVVSYDMTQNGSSESDSNGHYTTFLVIQIHVQLVSRS